MGGAVAGTPSHPVVRRMRVLLVSSLYEPHVVGGAERVVRALAEGVCEAGDDVAVLSLAPGGGRATDTVGGVRVHRVPLRNVYWPFGREARHPGARPVWHALDAYNPAMEGEAERVLDAERPDVVHTHNLAGFSVAVWRAARRRRIPLVHTIHDYYLMCPRTSMFRDGRNCGAQHLACRLYTGPRRMLAGLPDAVVGISRFALDRHLAHGYFAGVARREVIPNGYRAPGAPPPARAPGGPLRAGFIGQLTPVKGVETLLREARELPPGGWELRVAGKGAPEYEERLRTELAGPGVRFLGFTRAEDFYREIDVLVVPSLWHEPFGMVVIEAFAHGVPVVGSRRGAIPEIVQDGRTGILFDPDARGELRDALAALAAEPRRLAEMRPRCLERARDFDPGAVIRSYRALYGAVAGGPGGAALP